MTTATPAPLVFSPYDYAVHEDPYPFYARLRDEAPVYHNPELDFWALSKYTDVREAFRAPEVFSSAMGVSLDPAAYGPHAYKTMSFLAMDDPRHARLRRLVSKGFTARRVDSLSAGIEKISRQYWEDCLQRARDGESFDFVDAYAGKLPMDVISDLMGVPEADRERVFDRFVRLDEARRRDSGGAGLGLAVVAAVAAASGGRASVTDSALGGARFELRLPAAP